MISMKVDPISARKLEKRFKILSTAYPEETFRAIIKILFDIKLLAQKKIKADGHIVTSRLRNSIFVKTPKQKFANRSGNKRTYNDNEGNSFDADLNVKLRGAEGAVGTNVIYARKIEDLDSYLGYAVNAVDMAKRFREIPGAANKKIK